MPDPEQDLSAAGHDPVGSRHFVTCSGSNSLGSIKATLFIHQRLEEKRTIPMVNDRLDLIFDLQQDEYWADITLPMLEDVRKRLRDLVKFIDKKQRKLIYTDFEDELGPIIEGEYVAPPSPINVEQYKKKVMSFLREHENHIALQKLKRNIPITASDIRELERILFQTDGLGRQVELFRS